MLEWPRVRSLLLQNIMANLENLREGPQMTDLARARKRDFPRKKQYQKTHLCNNPNCSNVFKPRLVSTHQDQKLHFCSRACYADYQKKIGVKGQFQKFIEINL